MNTLFVIAGVGILALIAEIVNLKRWLTIICILGLAGALAFLPWYTSHVESAPVFNNMLLFDGPAVAFTWLIVIVSVLWLWMSGSYLREGAHQTDKTSLVIFVVLGAVIMASFNNMAMLFLGLEILSLSLYALAGSKKDSLNSIESAFKYFLMGSFATGFLIFGIALVYGASHSFNLGEIFNFVRANYDALPGYFYAGVLLMMVGLAFKISSVPSHFWAPDVYEGAPTAITSLMATVVKIAAVAAFWRIFGFIFGLTNQYWISALYAMVVLTLVIPNITAIYQTKAKRMLAYSSIAHAGYLLIGVACFDGDAVVFYLVAYLLMTLLSFAVLVVVAQQTGEEIGDFDGLGSRSPFLAFAMLIGMVSLAGLPFTAGFFGKFLVFYSAIAQRQIALVAVGIITVACGFYYYLKVVRAMYWQPASSVRDAIPLNGLSRTAISAMTAATIFLGIYPQPILHAIKSPLGQSIAARSTIDR
jgi:NADH-quinone oxidoreductase subunit N